MSLKRMAVLLPVLVMACGGGRQASQPSGIAANEPGPSLIVERFLQAANSNDLTTMVTLFGTADRRIDQLESTGSAQRRMYALASMLRHDDFQIQGQEIVPGRMADAVEVRVRIRRGDRVTVVPHLVVRRKGGGWIIERIDTEALVQRS